MLIIKIDYNNIIYHHRCPKPNWPQGTQKETSVKINYFYLLTGTLNKWQLLDLQPSKYGADKYNKDDLYLVFWNTD